MIATFFTYIFHDTFTVLKVFSKQNEPEQKSLQTAVFFHLYVIHILFSFLIQQTNQIAIYKKKCLLKLKGTKGAN